MECRGAPAIDAARIFHLEPAVFNPEHGLLVTALSSITAGPNGANRASDMTGNAVRVTVETRATEIQRAQIELRTTQRMKRAAPSP